VHVVSQRLGHASPTITMTVYAHGLPGRQSRMASVSLGAKIVHRSAVSLADKARARKGGKR
jgi:hypothetical protein